MIHVYAAIKANEEDHGFDGTFVVVSEKDYWEEEGCAQDWQADKEVSAVLNKYGFFEDSESSFSGEMAPEEILEKLKSEPLFEFDQAFADFIAGE